MNEILSKEELESLLSAVDLAEGEILPSMAPTPDLLASRRFSVKMYDFRRPDKFSKDQIRTIQMIHETYARLLSTSLSAQLRNFVGVRLSSVDQLSYDEFSKSVPTPSTLIILNMDPLKGSAVVEMEPSITFAIIDRLFGGPGHTLKDVRELTDIELSVMEGVVTRIMGSLREAWASVIDLRPRLSNIETNIQFAQIVPPNDMVVLVSMDLRIGEVGGATNFCIPYITIEPVVNKLSAQYWYSAARRGEELSTKAMQKQISEVPVEMVVSLGKITLRMDEILDLKIGDVLRLKSKMDQPVGVYVSGRRKYLARPLVVGSKISVQIAKLEKQQEEVEDDKEEEF